MAIPDDEIRLEVIIRGDFVGALLELLGQHPEEPQRSAAGRNPKGKEPPVYLTVEAAAAILGVSAHTLEDWRWKRKGPPWIRISRSCVRYDQKVLQDWLASRSVQAIPKT
jgi:hypothetical protein